MHIRTDAWMQPCNQTLHSWLRGMQHSMLPHVATRVVHAHTHTCMDATVHSDTALMAQRHAAQHAPASSHEHIRTHARMQPCTRSHTCTHGTEACSTACYAAQHAPASSHEHIRTHAQLQTRT